MEPTPTHDHDATPSPLRAFLAWKPFIYALVIAAVVIAAVEYQVLAGLERENDQQAAAIAVLKAKNDEHEKLNIGYSEFLAQKEAIEREALEVVEQLPADEELPPVLLDIQGLATDHHVSLDKTKWLDAKPLQGANAKYPQVVERPLVINVRGEYRDVLSFFQAFERFPRVFVARSIAFDHEKKAEIRLKTFFKRPPDPEAAKKEAAEAAEAAAKNPKKKAAAATAAANETKP